MNYIVTIENFVLPCDKTHVDSFENWGIYLLYWSLHLEKYYNYKLKPPMKIFVVNY